jgi:hypothetical protein
VAGVLRVRLWLSAGAAVAADAGSVVSPPECPSDNVFRLGGALLGKIAALPEIVLLTMAAQEGMLGLP